MQSSKILKVIISLTLVFVVMMSYLQPKLLHSYQPDHNSYRSLKLEYTKENWQHHEVDKKHTKENGQHRKVENNYTKENSQNHEAVKKHTKKNGEHHNVDKKYQHHKVDKKYTKQNGRHHKVDGNYSKDNAQNQKIKNNYIKRNSRYKIDENYTKENDHHYTVDHNYSKENRQHYQAHNTDFLNNTLAKNDLAIFYNVYIPPENTTNALRIVKEQLASRSASVLLSNTTLFYTHIGNLNVAFPPCHPCTRLAAVPEGDEVLTLQAMYDYCTINPSGRAIYIHSKGSFTRTLKNELLRRVLTKAVFSDECVKMPKGKQCNVCMAKFLAMPFHCVLGNMFLAECDYINQLIPPKDFTAAKEKLMRRLWNMTRPELQSELVLEKELVDGDWRQNWQFQRPSWVGTDRYAMEHWLTSHPRMQPCDVFDGYFAYNNPPSYPERITPLRYFSPRETRKHFVQKIHPFFLLAGRLYTFKQLYHEEPPKSSWMHHFYTN